MKSLKETIDQAIVESFNAKRANIATGIANIDAKLVTARCLYLNVTKENKDNAHGSFFNEVSEISETYINLFEKRNYLQDKLNILNMAYAAWKADAGLA